MNKIRALILSGFVSLLGVLCHAESQPIGSPWSGLNNADTSILINNNEAQDLLNVDLTDSASGVRKRAGYDDFRTIGVSTWGVRGGYYYRNSAAADLVIHANGKTVSKSANAGAYTAFLTTGTNGAYWDFTDSLGYLYGANSSNDEIWRYDGTTLSYFPNHPKGDQIEFTSNRLAISGTTANPKRVTFCKASDPTDCTTSSDVNDAFSEDMDMPGQRNTAINYACGGLEVWTKEAMSFIAAQDQYDFIPTEVLSKTIGTIQPYSVVDDLGVTYWQGQDNHFYSYDCSVIRKISSKLDVSNIVSGEGKSWVQTTQADWGAGTLVNTSSTSSPGDVVMTAIPTAFHTVFDGSSTPDAATPAWTLTGTPETASSAGGIFTYADTSGSSNYKRASGTDWATLARTTAPYVIQMRMKVTSQNLGADGNGFYLFFDDEAYGNSLRFNYNTITGPLQTVGLYTPLGGVLSEYTMSDSDYHTYTMLRSSTSVKVYVDGTLAIDQTRTDTTTNANTIGFGNLSPASVLIDYVQYIPQYTTGTFQSQSFNVGTAITSWGTFDVSNVLNNGTITYAIYGDSNDSFTPSNSATFTSSQTITAGSLITIPTAAYVGWVASFSRSSTTYNPTINDATVNWFEGSVTRHWGSVDKDHRIIWSVAEGTATAPNVSYIYDPRFDAWLKYSFAMDAVARAGDINYFGGVSTGVVYKWPSGNTDDGSAITAYWKSKDFIAPDISIEKDFMAYGGVFKAQTGSNLDITYTINTSSTVTNNFSLTDSNGNTIRRINANMPSGRFGTFISWKFGNDDGDAPFEVYAFKYDYRPRPWRVLP